MINKRLTRTVPIARSGANINSQVPSPLIDNGRTTSIDKQ